MDETVDASLFKLGRDAAEMIAGKNAVEQVDVVPGADFDYRPIYHFSFLINPDHAEQKLGTIMMRVYQKLRDDLTARGEERYPMIHLLDRVDWNKRVRA